MKVLNQYEIGQLLQAIIQGSATIVYAREAKEGIVYCTFKHTKPMIENLPIMKNEPSI